MYDGFGKNKCQKDRTRKMIGKSLRKRICNLSEERDRREIDREKWDRIE